MVWKLVRVGRLNQLGAGAVAKTSPLARSGEGGAIGRTSGGAIGRTSVCRRGSPKEGDMIARNPKNHADQWLVAKKYFEDNLEPA